MHHSFNTSFKICIEIPPPPPHLFYSALKCIAVTFYHSIWVCKLYWALLVLNKQLHSNSLQDTNTHQPLSYRTALYRSSIVYFCANDLRHVIAAENKMRHTATTNTAHDPQGTTKISMAHALICSISSEVRSGPGSEWSGEKNCFVKQVVLGAECDLFIRLTWD